jgi:hypothetical protein
MELKIKVICEDLPGKELLDQSGNDPIDRQNIYLGIQCGNDVIEAVPINRKQIIFEPSFRVSPLADGKTNFLGPYAKGPQSERFFYLSWVVKDIEGNVTKLGRSKVHLSHLMWSQVEELARSDKSLEVALSLTGKRGMPRFGSIRGDDLKWRE